MENIAHFATLLCVAAVSSGILVFLIPDGRLKKTAEIVVSLFFTVAVISVFNTDNNVEFDYSINSFSEIPDSSEKLNEYLIEQSKRVTEDLIIDELSVVCNNEFSVETSWHADEKSICMDSVTIYINHSDASEISLVKTRIIAITGISPEVKYQ